MLQRSDTFPRNQSDPQKREQRIILLNKNEVHVNVMVSTENTCEIYNNQGLGKLGESDLLAICLVIDPSFDETAGFDLKPLRLFPTKKKQFTENW